MGRVIFILEMKVAGNVPSFLSGGLGSPRRAISYPDGGVEFTILGSQE